MKVLPVALAFSICGCINGVVNIDYAGKDEPVGYPVFVSKVGGKCTYGIQDVVGMGSSNVRSWMKKLRHKDRQVDLVDKGAGIKCLSRAYRYVSGAGFSNIVVRKLEGQHYPSGLPPT